MITYCSIEKDCFRFIELGLLVKSSLEQLQFHQTIGKTATLLYKYIEFAVEEDNKIKTALGSLKALKDDPKNTAHKDKVISLIKELNLQENKELLDIL